MMKDKHVKRWTELFNEQMDVRLEKRKKMEEAGITMGDMMSMGMACQVPPGGVLPAPPVWVPINTHPVPEGPRRGQPSSGL